MLVLMRDKTEWGEKHKKTNQKILGLVKTNSEPYEKI